LYTDLSVEFVLRERCAKHISLLASCIVDTRVQLSGYPIYKVIVIKVFVVDSLAVGLLVGVKICL
jgi:hypothetical protein